VVLSLFLRSRPPLREVSRFPRFEILPSLRDRTGAAGPYRASFVDGKRSLHFASDTNPLPSLRDRTGAAGPYRQDDALAPLPSSLLPYNPAMPHSVALITTIAASLGLALILGFIAVRLKLPAIVGYLVAGMILSPATPGFTADVDLAGQLAEIGVMLLMFGVGLHFSLDDLLGVRKIALPGAVVQIAVATAMGAGLAVMWGWDLFAAIVFGLSLSVASTVVLLRALESRGILESVNGKIAVGWLIVEDIAMVLILVLLPPWPGSSVRGPRRKWGSGWE
jgi:hypothetical protein